MFISFSSEEELSKGYQTSMDSSCLGVIISIYIMSQCNINQIIIGTMLILVGIPIYVLFAPKTEIKTVRKDLLLGEDYVSQTIERDEIFLAKFIKQVRELVLRIRKI